MFPNMKYLKMWTPQLPQRRWDEASAKILIAESSLLVDSLYSSLKATFFKGIMCMSWMASFLDEAFRVGYRMLGSLLENPVMVQFKWNLYFSNLFRVFIFFTLFEILRMVPNEIHLAN